MNKDNSYLNKRLSKIFYISTSQVEIFDGLYNLILFLNIILILL